MIRKPVKPVSKLYSIICATFGFYSLLFAAFHLRDRYITGSAMGCILTFGVICLIIVFEDE